MTFTFSRQSLPFRTDFQVAGAQCLLSTNSNEILSAAARWRGAKQRDFHPFEMEIIVDASLNNSAGHQSYFRGNRHLVFGLLPPGCLVIYDLLRRRVRAVLSTGASRDKTFWDAVLLPVTIGVLGTTLGVAPLHCACLERDGNGLLVAGPSGAGKSTLTAALAQRGFALISDDWTYISSEKSRLLAHGLSSPIKLLPDTVRFFSELGELTPRITLNGELAYQIDPRQSMGFGVKDATQPRRIFFLERTANPGCHFVPCRPGYVREFFENSSERLPNELKEAELIRSGIIQSLSRLPTWILQTGESPQRTADAVDHFLAEAQYAAG